MPCGPAAAHDAARQEPPATSDRPIEKMVVRALIDQIPDFLFVKDSDSRFIMANAAIGAAYGTTPDILIGKTDFDLHPRDRAQGFFDFEQEVIRTGACLTDMEESFPDSDGVQRWYATTKLPLRGPDNAVIGLIGISRDITGRKQAESLLIQQSAILELIARNEPLTPVLNRLCLLVESQLHGIKASILLTDDYGRLLHHGAAPSLPRSYTDAVDGVAIGPHAGSCGTAAYRAETVIVTDIETDPLWAGFREPADAAHLRSCWSTPILSHNGSVVGTFALYAADVRAPNDDENRLIEMAVRLAGIAILRDQSEARIRFIAHHDALTGLPNRTLLSDRLFQAMLHAERNDTSVSVVFVDLDNFKMVNDGLGHSAGDKLLKIVAARMLTCTRPCDTVVRLGGDEFVILLLDQTGNGEGVTAILQRIKTVLAEPIDMDSRIFQVSCSMGIAVYPHDGTTVETLLKNADAAMYSAKAEGGNRLQFYAPAMNAKVLERLHLQEQLRNAIAHGELTVLYQPQVDLRSGTIYGAEALLRWHHPVLGNVPPSTFIPIAEASGLIVPIGDWVLRTACRQNKAWQEAGLPPLVMAVNVSARQFREVNWTARVATTLRETRLSPTCLELELTESMLMNDLPCAVATMRELTDLGIRLSVDDFGTGYSSLNTLKSFPVCRLKIDQSFVRDLPDDENDKAITAAIISLGQSLGLRVIAEGVETEQQRAFLVGSHCDEMQGYLVSRPVCPAEIERLLKANGGKINV